MAVDVLARALAAKALETAESGSGSSGSGGKQLDFLQIIDKHLWVFFTDGDSSDLGQVVGKDGSDGKVYVPHIDDDSVLSWTIEDAAGELPEPLDLSDDEEWGNINGISGETNYVWESMSDYINSLNNNNNNNKDGDIDWGNIGG